jgi:mannosyltransferase OCH1-like enzyme
MATRLEQLLAEKRAARKSHDEKLPVCRTIFADHAPIGSPTARPRPAPRATTQTIPKIRHLIWLGSPLAPRHVEWLKSWQRHMPDWQIRIWDDAAVAGLPVVRTDMWKTATSLAQRADLLRYWLVCEFGGVYADTDVQCLRPLDPLLSSKPITCFVGEEKPKRICNAVLGAIPRHPFLLQLNERIKDNWFKHTDILNRSANFFLMRTLRDFRGPASVHVFPPRCFYPYLWDEKEKYPAGTDFERAFPAAYLVHHWDASWQTTPSREGAVKV